MKQNHSFFRRFIFIEIFIVISGIVASFIFMPIYQASKIVIPYALHPFDICKSYPNWWKNIKVAYILFYILANGIIANMIYMSIKNKIKSKKTKKQIEEQNNKDELKIFVGKNQENNLIYIPEKSLYQNILITGTIGSGKTSSCMYPITKQLISYQSQNKEEKIGMLILDVKGNYYKKVEEYCERFNRQKDLNVIELGGKIKYNPLDKPNLKPIVLANRLKTILTLFSPNNQESYWLDKAEQILCESIKLCRLYNEQYVTFQEIHKLITIPDYYLDKLDIIKELFISGKLNKKQCYDALSSIEFFEKEFNSLDQRTLSILKSEITRITNNFISDYDVMNTFSPTKEKMNFKGFEELIKEGKILVLNMNIAEYKNLSKIIATYLKLDFQTEVMQRLTKEHSETLRKVAFISDEFHEYITATDAEFFAQSREAKCINIVATQSYTSLLNAINNQNTVKAIIQNLINKFWFRTDDIFTIEDAQKQIGKEAKIKYSTSISESAKETNYSYILNRFQSQNSNISESINKYEQIEYVYDTNFFSQKLETFNCLAFLSNGYKIIPPIKLKLIPHFIQDNYRF